MGCAPGIPALPPPGTVGSKVFESCRERRDFEGKADCENGVMGDVMPADVLAPPAAFPEKDVISWGGDWLDLLTGVGGLCMAERAMYVSRHLATQARISFLPSFPNKVLYQKLFISRILCFPLNARATSSLKPCRLTQDCFFKLPVMVDIEELASS